MTKNYIDNKQFSIDVNEYVKQAIRAKNEGREIPKIPNSVALSFQKIAERLSTKYNFSRYTYRDEMVADAVENCLRAIMNYSIAAETRTGAPNAFAYFTRVIFNAFLRRIKKENHQRNIKTRYINNVGLDQYIEFDYDAPAESAVIMNYVNDLRSKLDEFNGDYKTDSDK